MLLAVAQHAFLCIQVYGKICNFTGNRDYINKKTKETRVVAYTYIYFSGHLIPNSATAINIGINCLLEYLQVQATTLVSLLFIYIIPIACKIAKNFHILVRLLF